MKGESLRVAIIGLGKMGLLHSSILNVLPNIELAAFCDKSVLIRKFFRKVFNRVHIVDDVEKLLDFDLDAVYVTTPISSHYFITKMIYSKRIVNNVFVEKTLGSTFAQAKELCNLARSFGGINQVGYMKRFAVTFRKAKDLLNQTVLGELSSFDAYAYSSDFFGVNESSRTSGSRGGALRDLGSHVIDLALWFFGDLQVDSATLESVSGRNSEDCAVFSVKNSSSLEGRVSVSWCMKEHRLPEFGLVIIGPKGTMKVDGDKVELQLNNGKTRWYRHDLDDSVRFLLGEPEYFREDECFVKSVLKGVNPEPSFYTASKVDHVIDQVKHRAGKDVC